MRSALLCLAMAATLATAAEPEAVRQRELLHMLRHDCGACHGMTLRGGLGPPLTEHALAGRPPQLLIATIQNGRPGTPMPPWRAMLSDEEATWLVNAMLRGVDTHD